MFVRHIEDKDVFECGFVLNPLFNESFSREKIDTKFISTHMQVWIDVNSYRYKVVTDREGDVEYGTVYSKEILQGIVGKYFDHDKINFIRRNLKKVCGDVDKNMMQTINASLPLMSEEKISEIFINNFGENYEEAKA